MALIFHLLKSTKFLGVMVDNILSWNEHVSFVESKLNINKHLLKTTKNILPLKCLRSIHFSHIHSHLQYGLLSWGSLTSKKNIKTLSKIQNSCIRIMTGKTNCTSIKDDYNKLKIVSLEDMIKIELAKFGYSITHKKNMKTTTNDARCKRGEKDPLVSHQK